MIVEDWSRAADRVGQLAVVLRRDIRRLVEAGRRDLQEVRRHEVFRRPSDTVNRRRQHVDLAASSFEAAMNHARRHWGERLRIVADRLRRHHPAAVLRRRHVLLETFRRRLDAAGQRATATARRRLTIHEAKVLAHDPSRHLQADRSRLWQASDRLTRTRPNVNDHRTVAKVLATRLQEAIAARHRQQVDSLRAEAQKLDLLGPNSVLARGYSITTRSNGDVVQDAADVAAGEMLQTRVGRGTISSRVE